MALSIYLEVSPGSPGSAPSVADGAFLPFGDPIEDTGDPIDFEHLISSSPAVIAGVLYAYRTRRYDDATGLFSPWSPIAFCRALTTYKEAVMAQEGIFDRVITGATVKIGVGIEPRYGFAVKAQKLLEVESQGIKAILDTLFANTLDGTPTMRNKMAPGMGKISGPLNILMTPEGGWLLLMQSLLPDTVTGSSSPYTHTFKNLFGAKSVTLHIVVGNYLFTVSGVRVDSMKFNGLVAEATAMVMADTSIVATNIAWYDLSVNTGALAACNMDVAAADSLSGYSGVNMQSWIDGYFGTVKSANLEIKNNLTGRKGGNGKRGFSEYYASKIDITASANVYFEGLELIRRDYGIADATPTPFGPSMIALAVPFSLMIAPPNNGSGFSNLLTFKLPGAVLQAPIEVKDDKEVDQTVTFQSTKLPGNTDGTDFVMTLRNSVAASGITAGTPVANHPMTELTWYFSAAVAAAPAPTTTVFSADTNNLGAFSTVDNDPIVLTRSVYFLTGTLAGTTRKITAYTAPTGGAGPVITVGTAFGSAPTAGDLFTFV